MCVAWPLGCLEGAREVSVLEQQWDGHEHEVQDEHGEAETLVHLPVEAGDGHDDEDQHEEEDGDGTHHADTVHLHGLSVDDAVQ